MTDEIRGRIQAAQEYLVSAMAEIQKAMEYAGNSDEDTLEYNLSKEHDRIERCEARLGYVHTLDV